MLGFLVNNVELMSKQFLDYGWTILILRVENVQFRVNNVQFLNEQCSLYASAVPSLWLKNVQFVSEQGSVCESTTLSFCVNDVQFMSE